MSDLTINVADEAGRAIVYFSGAITEDSDFSGAQGLNGDLVFDLENINLINSCGIRDWIQFQNSLDVTSISYRKCPKVVVEQMNMVQGFIRQSGNVISFYAPYYDEKNDNESMQLLSPSDIINFKAPVKHNEDGDELEFDDIEEQYFSFLKNL